MKKLLFVLGFLTLLSSGCKKKTDTEVLEKVAALEARIAVLEKAAVAARPAGEAEQTTAYDIPVGNSYILGNPKAPLTITKFSDYQCPFCAKAHHELIGKVMEDPELKDKVKVVFKHFPLSFHKQARPASKFALAVGEQGHDCFWKITNKFYENKSDLTEENFKKWAGEITCTHNDGKTAKLNATKAWDDYKKNDAKYEKEITENMELAMKSGVRGTPSFFINGWRIKDRTVQNIKDIIKQRNL